MVVSRYGRGGSAKEIQNNINERGLKKQTKAIFGKQECRFPN